MALSPHDPVSAEEDPVEVTTGVASPPLDIGISASSASARADARTGVTSGS